MINPYFIGLYQDLFFWVVGTWHRSPPQMRAGLLIPFLHSRLSKINLEIPTCVEQSQWQSGWEILIVLRASGS